MILAIKAEIKCPACRQRNNIDISSLTVRLFIARQLALMNDAMYEEIVIRCSFCREELIAKGVRI